MNTGPTPLSERDPYPFPQPEGDLQFRGKDDSKNYKDPHKIISRKEVIFQKFDSIFDEISKKNVLENRKVPEIIIRLNFRVSMLSLNIPKLILNMTFVIFENSRKNHGNHI